MVNNWKRLCLILLSIVILESVYIFKIRFDERRLSLQANNWKSSAVYYGNSGKAEVQFTATRDFMQMKNSIDDYGIFDYEISIEPEKKGSTFLWGNVYLFSAPEFVNDTNARIVIYSNEKKFVNVNLWKKENEDGNPIQEMFFYVNGTEAFEINEISRCTIQYGETQLEVDMELIETKTK